MLIVKPFTIKFYLEGENNSQNPKFELSEIMIKMESFTV